MPMIQSKIPRITSSITRMNLYAENLTLTTLNAFRVTQAVFRKVQRPGRSKIYLAFKKKINVDSVIETITLPTFIYNRGREDAGLEPKTIPKAYF